MKRFLAFLLTTALILSMGTTAFAFKGGDGDLNGEIAFEFSSAEVINGLGYISGRTFSVDTANANSYPVTARLTVGTQTQAHFYLTEHAVSVFGNPKYNYVNVLINNGQDTAREVSIYVAYNSKGVATLQPGWNIVTLPKRNLVNEDNYTYTTGSSLRFAANTTTSGEYYNVDKVWLTASEPGNSSYSYSVASDSAILWEFNSANVIESTERSTYKSPKFTADIDNINAYDVSAKFVTSTADDNATTGIEENRHLQLKILSNALIEKVSDSGAYVYDYINFLIGNPNGKEVGFGSGIPFDAKAYAVLPRGWSVVSFPIDTLFGSASASRARDNYTDLIDNGLAITNVAGANVPNEDGIVYNLDMIWVSKTPSAGTSNSSGTGYISQIPLTCTDAAVKADGTAGCKITSWPGERFAVILASYNNDGSLNSIAITKDYDGGENKETTVTTPAVTIPAGGTTKIMVWNGFGEMTPMTVAK